MPIAKPTYEDFNYYTDTAKHLKRRKKLAEERKQRTVEESNRMNNPNTEVYPGIRIVEPDKSWKQSESGAWYKVASPEPEEIKKKKKKEVGFIESLKNMKRGYNNFLKTLDTSGKPAKPGGK